MSILQVSQHATANELFDAAIIRLQAAKGALDTYPTCDDDPNPSSTVFSPLFCGASNQLLEVEALLYVAFERARAT